MNKIVEIEEIGNPRSLVRREGKDVSELVDTAQMIDEVNKSLWALYELLDTMRDIVIDYGLDHEFE